MLNNIKNRNWIEKNNHDYEYCVVQIGIGMNEKISTVSMKWIKFGYSQLKTKKTGF